MIIRILFSLLLTQVLVAAAVEQYEGVLPKDGRKGYSTELAVVNETPYDVTVMIEGERLCYMVPLKANESSMRFVHNAGVIRVGGVAYNEYGNYVGSWAMQEYYPTITEEGISLPLTVSLPESEMLPPD